MRSIDYLRENLDSTPQARWKDGNNKGLGVGQEFMHIMALDTMDMKTFRISVHPMDKVAFFMTFMSLQTCS